MVTSQLMLPNHRQLLAELLCKETSKLFSPSGCNFHTCSGQHAQSMAVVLIRKWCILVPIEQGALLCILKLHLIFSCNSSSFLSGAEDCRKINFICCFPLSPCSEMWKVPAAMVASQIHPLNLRKQNKFIWKRNKCIVKKKSRSVKC